MTELNDVLSSFEDKYFIGNELNKAKVIQDIDSYDEELIVALLGNEIVKKHYAKQIGEYTVIETNKLIETFEMDDYWMDSNTKYSKKIGLTVNGRFLDESTDVVLDFPYKDTVLKAGMSKEDVEKEDLLPNEPFYNEVIAAEEIDTLLDKKVLLNAKKYTSDGVVDAVEFNEDDNLILKGNNLLALHSLKEKYAGKVKLIYIDPPYNTGNDSFQYNDQFNHSSWLTFMKNRLDIAYELLSDTGSIWINIDDDESHYLKILSDGVFGRENFVANVVWQKKYTIANDARWFSDNHDHILVYAKNKNLFNVNGLERSEEMNSRYKNPDNDPKGPWITSPLHAKSGTDTNFSYTFNNGIEWSPPRGTFPRFSPATLKEFDENNMIWFGINGTAVPRVKKYLTEMGLVTPSTLWLHQDFGNNDQANKEVRALISDEEFSTPKPEKLLQKIIQIGSEQGHIILDFFMGSATTQAVAMKMNRRFIGIEQMDYINTVSVPRLQKVIEGEQGGISKDVNWQGGGSFVYVELMEKSKGYLESVLETEDTDSLKQIYQLMLENVDLDFRADLEQVQEMLNDGISLEDKKRLLVKVIDKNQLYYNYSEIDDANVRDLISDNDYAFNQSFYKEEEIDGQEDQ